MNPALIAVAAGGTALGLVLGDLQQRLEAVREAGKEYSDDLLQQIELGQSDITTREAERLRDDVQRIIDAITTDSDELVRLQDDYVGTLTSLTSIQDELNGLTASGQGSSEQARLLSEELVRTSTSLDRLDDQIRDRLHIEDESVDAYGALNAALENNTARIEEHQGTIDNYNAVLESGDLVVNDAREGLINFFDQLGEGVGVVSDLVTEAANTAREQLEAAQQSYELTNQIIGSLTNDVSLLFSEVVAAQNEVAKATEDIADARNDVAMASDKAIKAQEAVADVQSKGAERLADIASKHAEKLLDIQTDFNIKQEDRAEDLSDRLDEIEAQRLKTSKNAIAERDTLAFKMAQEAATDEANREQQQTAKDEQRDERNYRRAVEAAERANRRLVSVEEIRQRDELSIKRAAATTALSDLVATQQTETSLKRNYYAQNLLESATAGYQAGKVLLNNFLAAVNQGAGQIRIPGGDWRTGGNASGMTPVQVDRQIENAFRQVFAR